MQGRLKDENIWKISGQKYKVTNEIVADILSKSAALFKFSYDKLPRNDNLFW